MKGALKVKIMEKDLRSEIIRLKKEKNAYIVAHYYQPLEIQLIADAVGDSFELAKKCVKTNAERIIFCGVHFMGESAKILSPKKRVFVPASDAGCLMADTITPEKLSKLKKEHPDAAVVCYINSSAAVKALSTICCTSSNAKKVVESLKEKKIIFAPDKNLGSHIASMFPDKEFILFDGCCPIHDNVEAEEITNIKSIYPNAKVLAHPECAQSVTEKADFIGSTSMILSHCETAEESEFIIVTEKAIEERLSYFIPEKRFITASSKLECRDMKKITLDKIYQSLCNDCGEIILSTEISEKASNSLKRMMEINA